MYQVPHWEYGIEEDTISVVEVFLISWEIWVCKPEILKLGYNSPGYSGVYYSK